MKTRFDKIGYPLYCDAGPHEGDMRVDLTLRLYLSPQEYASYEGPESPARNTRRARHGRRHR